jgi:hypothetical protein
MSESSEGARLFPHGAKRENIRSFALLRVQQAISIGGGLAVLGSEWRIKIKRMSGNGQTCEVQVSLDDQVEAGDTISSASAYSSH